MIQQRGNVEASIVLSATSQCNRMVIREKHHLLKGKTATRSLYEIWNAISKTRNPSLIDKCLKCKHSYAGQPDEERCDACSLWVKIRI